VTLALPLRFINSNLSVGFALAVAPGNGAANKFLLPLSWLQLFTRGIRCWCPDSQFSLRAAQLAGDARVVPARGVHGARERLEQRLHDVMRLVAIKQFDVQVAAGLAGEALEEFARQPEPERAGGVLIFSASVIFFCENLSSPRQTRCGRPLKSTTQRAR